MLIEFRGFRCLLAADIPENVWRELVRAHGRGLRADVLQVSHHASIDGSSPEFLEAVGARLFVVLADRCFPSSRVLQRLRDRGWVGVTADEGHLVVAGREDGGYDLRTP